MSKKEDTSLDDARAPERRAQHRRSASAVGPRLMFAVVVLAIVAVGVTVTLAVANRVAAPSAGQGAVTKTSHPGSQQVTESAAIVDLMPLYRQETLSSADHVAATGNLSILAQAVAYGLLSQEEASNGSAFFPMTQGQYAVLLVKAFGNSLPDGAYPIQSVDPQATSSERAAIEKLMTDGIILPQDGDFVAGQGLTKGVEDRLLGRIEKAYSNSLQG